MEVSFGNMSLDEARERLGIPPEVIAVPVVDLGGLSYTGNGTKLLSVNATEDGLEFRFITSGDVTTALGFTPVTNARTISTTAPLTGGGDLSGNRTLSITGSALTKTDDTNVTLTLGGTPATALLAAVSLTLGWTGVLAVGRGGTGVSALGDITRTNDTNVTLTLGGTPAGSVIQGVSFTLGWTGTLAASRGGTGNGFTAFTGPTTSTKTFTLPDASDTIACLGQINAFTQRATITNSTASQTGFRVFGVSGAGISVDFNGANTNLFDGTTHIWRASGGGTTFLTINASAVNATVDFQRSGTKVVGARKTGWAVATGTAARTTYATYTSPTISNPPTQAEVQAIADHVQILSQRLKALIDDLHGTAGHGLIGT